MGSFTETFNQIMAFGVFALIAVCISLIYSLIRPKSSLGEDILAFADKHILWIGFFMSLAAVFSSLTYSNVIGFEPCMLCWYARIALYPGLALYAIALVKRDRSVLDYSLALTVLGMIVSGYHTIIENIGYTLIPCSTSGASCLARPVYEYGFITIPVMSLAACVTLFLFILAAKRGSKTSVKLTP